MKLSIRSQEDGVVHVQVQGRVSQRDLGPENEPLQRLLGDDAFQQQIIMDMSDVEAIDSSGVNWLLVCQKKLRESGGCVVLHSLSPIAKNVIRVLNLQKVFTLANDADEAVSLLDSSN